MLGCTDDTSSSRKQLSLNDLSDMRDGDYALNTQRYSESLEYFCAHDKGLKSVRSHLYDYYKHGGGSVWVDNWGADNRADSLLDILDGKLPQMGFDTRHFHLKEIRSDLERMRNLQFDETNDVSRVLARLEYYLNSAYLNYVVGQRFGFINPHHVLNSCDASEKDSTGKILAYHHLFDVDMEKASDDFFRQALSRVTIDSLGSFLRHSEPVSPLYHQLSKRLPSVTGSDRERVLVNMERCRWHEKIRPKEDEKYVIVNVPAYHLWAVSADTVIDMRAACGAMKTKTPLLSSYISHMQVNPEWVIPMSIIRNDVARHAGSPSYFSSRRYYIADRKTGKRLSPEAVTYGMLLSGRYKVAQEGGPGNSLGRIIFRFQNNFSVFLHDTSSPGVFQRDNRGVSHGCVRVQRPFDLALFMMGDEPDEWVVDKLRISMGMAPETEQGRDYIDALDPAVKTPRLVNSLNVSPRVPIIITYYTMFMTPDGVLRQYPDVYGYDSVIAEALRPCIQ